jgi:DtxR family transcriptional regulator, Mn-dependent transcriptional regulator
LVHPGIALAGFVLLLLGLYFLLRPRRGLVSRLARLARMTERIRLEDALKHLLHYEAQGVPCTTESLAGTLEISRGRAVAVLARLVRTELARPDGQGYRLTDQGRADAVRLLRTHRLLERYFADRTGLPAPDWHEEAERQEHFLSPVQTEQLASRMGHPLYDPHGDPIPSPTGELPPVSGVPLTHTAPGSMVRIVHLEDEPREVFERLVARGLSPGMALRVQSVDPASIRFTTEGREEVLEAVLAANVEVAAAPDEAVVDSGQTLAEVAVGEAAEVVGIAPACQGAQRRRLLDLGVVPGTVIRAAMASAAGDPVAYDIRGALVALRRRQAEWIRVRGLAGRRGEGEAA